MTDELSEFDDGEPVFIECYVADFLAEDPHSAASYAKVVASSFDFEIPEFADAAHFAGRSEMFCLPDVTVSRATSTASRFTRTIKSIATRGTDQILVVCYTSGHFDMTISGQTTRVEAVELAFIDLSREVMIEAPTVANISLAISRRKLEAIVPFLDAAHGYVRPADALSKLLLGMLETIAAVGPAMPVVDARGVAGAMLQLVAACLEPLSRQSVEAGAGRNTVSLVAMKAFIEQHLLEATLGPQVLLDTFGITRSTLYRMFEPLGGVSAYIAHRKLSHAFRLLSDTRQPRGRISKLASELGFSHASAFTRAFKETFGLSPKDVQTLAQQSREQEVQLLTSAEQLEHLRPMGGDKRAGAAE